MVLLLAADLANPPDIWTVMIPYLVVISLLYFFMSSPKRREQSRRDLSLKNLKKNDRVVTIGGLFGSVVNISTDGSLWQDLLPEQTQDEQRRTVQKSDCRAGNAL